MNWKKKHKALEEKYEHYVCERCMEIGTKEVTKEFLESSMPIDDWLQDPTDQ